MMKIKKEIYPVIVIGIFMGIIYLSKIIGLWQIRGGC